jgi:hypothetical protein
MAPADTWAPRPPSCRVRAGCTRLDTIDAIQGPFRACFIVSKGAFVVGIRSCPRSVAGAAQSGVHWGGGLALLPRQRRSALCTAPLQQRCAMNDRPLRARREVRPPLWPCAAPQVLHYTRRCSLPGERLRRLLRRERCKIGPDTQAVCKRLNVCIVHTALLPLHPLGAWWPLFCAPPPRAIASLFGPGHVLLVPYDDKSRPRMEPSLRAAADAGMCARRRRCVEFISMDMNNFHFLVRLGLVGPLVGCLHRAPCELGQPAPCLLGTRGCFQAQQAAPPDSIVLPPM